MSQFNLSKNLMQLRYQKGITQEKLADFLGVSKASVSKWETGQSLPDIAQLPRLAAFYDVTIDELMGYEAKLSLKEVKEYYLKFSEKFATEEFDKVLGDVRDFIRMYYSCDVAILQMVLLLMNHLMLATPEMQAELIEEMVGLCEHIREKSDDVEICNSAILFQSNLELMRGNAMAVIEKLEYKKNPMHLSDGADVLLIRAYQVAGKTAESKEWNQVAIYKDLLSLVQNSVNYLFHHLQDKEVAQETMTRVEKIIEAYDLRNLHANMYLQFVYAKAMFLSAHQMPDEAMDNLKDFVECAVDFLKNNPTLHGDGYFDMLDNYFAKYEDYMMLPRDSQTVLSTLEQQLMHPAFTPLFEREDFIKLINRLKFT